MKKLYSITIAFILIFIPMKVGAQDYILSTDKSRIQFERVSEMLRSTDYAKNWSDERIRKIIENSRCYGLYTMEGRQIGFVKAVTDFELVCYISALVIDKAYQGLALGTKLLDFLLNDAQLKNCFFVLYCSDENTQKIYEKFRFRVTSGEFMLLQE